MSGDHLQSPDVDEKELPAVSLHLLKDAMSNKSHDEKSAFAHVQRVRPDLVNDDHMTKFLRFDDFDVDLAATRLAKYWVYREKMLGRDRYAFPLTLNGAMKEDIDAVKAGFLTLLPVTDEKGRAIIYIDASKFSLFHEDQYLRVWWYILHVAMEDPSLAEAGFVLLTNEKGTTLRMFSTKFARGFTQSEKMIPIHWRTTHCCHFGANLYPIIKATLRALMSPLQRDTLVLHNGTDDEVVEELSNKYSFNRKCIPEGMGGSLQISMDTFIKERLAKETGLDDFEDLLPDSESANTKKPSSNCVEASILGLDWSFKPSWHEEDNYLARKPSAILQEVVEVEIKQPDEQMASHPTYLESNKPPTPLRCKEGKSATPQRAAQTKKRDASSQSGSTNYSEEEKSPPAGKKIRIHLGSQGDPRMNRAVQLRMNDPKLPLIDALVAGGFIFPDINNLEGKRSACKDADGVTVHQRRNQLMRRIRHTKKKEQEKESLGTYVSPKISLC